VATNVTQIIRKLPQMAGLDQDAGVDRFHDVVVDRHRADSE
jgi:hypothetical protein